MDPRMAELARASAEVLNARITDMHDDETPLSEWEDDDCPRLLTMMVKQGRYTNDAVRTRHLFRLVEAAEYARMVVAELEKANEHATRLPPDGSFPLEALAHKDMYLEGLRYSCPRMDPMGERPLRIGYLGLALREAVLPLATAWVRKVYGLFVPTESFETLEAEAESDASDDADDADSEASDDGLVPPEEARELCDRIGDLLADDATLMHGGTPIARLTRLLEERAQRIVDLETPHAKRCARRDRAGLLALDRLTHISSAANAHALLTEAHEQLMRVVVRRVPPELQNALRQLHYEHCLGTLAAALNEPRAFLRAEVTLRWVCENGRVVKSACASALQRLQQWTPLSYGFRKVVYLQAQERAQERAAPRSSHRQLASVVRMPPPEHAPATPPVLLVVDSPDGVPDRTERLRLGLRPARAALLRFVSAMREIVSLGLLPVGCVRAQVVTQVTLVASTEASIAHRLAHARIAYEGLFVGQALRETKAEFVDSGAWGGYANEVARASDALRDFAVGDLFARLRCFSDEDDGEGPGAATDAAPDDHDRRAARRRAATVSRQHLRERRACAYATELAEQMRPLVRYDVHCPLEVETAVSPEVAIDALCIALKSVLRLRQHVGLATDRRITPLASGLLVHERVRSWLVKWRQRSHVLLPTVSIDRVELDEAEVSELPEEARRWLLEHALSTQDARAERRARRPVPLWWEDGRRTRTGRSTTTKMLVLANPRELCNAVERL